MKRTNPIYFVFVIFGLFMFMVGIIPIFMFSDGPFFTGFPFIAIPVIMLIMIFGFVTIAIRLSNGTFMQRLNKFKECPSCHNEIPIESEYCPKCGISLDNKIICEYCGTENGPYNVTCTNCNAHLN